MNERIKELWLQSAREDSGDTWDSQTEFIERFANKIVRECLSYAKDGDIDFMKFMIKKHFGVEE